MSSRLSSLLSCSILLAAPLAAQPAVDLGPLVGYYRPLGHFDPASVYVTSLPGSPSALSGVAWGGAARVALGRRFGAEGQLSVAGSTLPSAATPAGETPPTSARVLVLTAQAQYDVSPAPQRFRLWVGAGPGLVRHGGDAYAPYGTPVSLAGALGAAADVPLGARVRAAAGVDALLYAFDVAMPPALRGNPGSLQHGFRHDALVHVGLRWRPW